MLKEKIRKETQEKQELEWTSAKEEDSSKLTTDVDHSTGVMDLW